MEGPQTIKKSWVWWCISVIPAFRKQRQENQEFKASLGYVDPVSRKIKK
jgi:hypothetical protein